MVHDPGDQILVLAKSIDLSWKTTRAILMLDSGVNAAEYIDRYKIEARNRTVRHSILPSAGTCRENAAQVRLLPDVQDGICAARCPAVVPAILPNTEPAIRPVPPG